MKGEHEIGAKSKTQLLEEGTAFANAYGGTLVLGIQESTAKPPVATGLSLIPRCAELADRFRNIFRDCVEPKLLQLEITPIPVDGEDGIVVIQVPRSRRAPHRVTTSQVCPVRRGDRCESMSMREIQDMTLNVSHEIERLEQRLEKRSEALKNEMNRLSNPHDCFGIRLTAFPIGEEILFNEVFNGERSLTDLVPPRPT